MSFQVINLDLLTIVLVTTISSFFQPPLGLEVLDLYLLLIFCALCVYCNPIVEQHPFLNIVFLSVSRIISHFLLIFLLYLQCFRVLVLYSVELLPFCHSILYPVSACVSPYQKNGFCICPPLCSSSLLQSHFDAYYQS